MSIRRWRYHKANCEPNKSCTAHWLETAMQNSVSLSFIHFELLHTSPNSTIVLSEGPGVKSFVFKGFTSCVIYREIQPKWGSGAHLRKYPTESECEIIIRVIRQNTRAHKHKDVHVHTHRVNIHAAPVSCGCLLQMELRL